MKNTLINNITKVALVIVPAMAFTLTANAHDPKLHAKKPEKADCSKMDHSKMDKKDPVAMAMMKKCMKQAKQAKKDMDHGKMDMDHSKMKHDDKNKDAEKDNAHSDH
jgi:uncharacterized protein involved in copper resistance